MITMWKNICPYIFSFILSRIETSDQYYQNISFLYTNHKSQNGKFLWLDNTYFFFLVSYYFSSFMALKTKMGSFYALIRHLFLVTLLCFTASKTKMTSFHDLIKTLFLVLLLHFWLQNQSLCALTFDPCSFAWFMAIKLETEIFSET